MTIGTGAELFLWGLLIWHVYYGLWKFYRQIVEFERVIDDGEYVRPAQTEGETK